MKRTLLAIVAVTLVSNVFAADPAGYAARRARLAKEIGPNAMLIVFSPRPARRNGDVDYPYRQSDNVLYLTGIDEPETTLVMIPGDPEVGEIVFTRDSNPRAELYTGRVPTHEEITKMSGIKRVESAGAWRQFVAMMLAGGPWRSPGDNDRSFRRAAPNFYKTVLDGNAEIWLAHVSRGSMNQPLSDEQQFANDLRERYPEVRFRDAQPLLRTMREIKSASELATLQRAIDITAAAQKAAMKRVLTATNESQVDGVISQTYRELGADGWGFPSIVASGTNATVLHYEINNAAIDRNGLLLTDLGAEVEGYTADVTRTYPADGTFSPEQRAIYEAVLNAQNTGIAAAKPGVRYSEVDRAATASLGRDLLKLGLITKDEPKQVLLYFRHGPGHHLGLDVHDVADYDKNLAPGMILTVEPGVYVRRDDILASPVFKALTKDEQEKMRAAVDKYNGIGVRIEDDIVVTDGEPRLLSGGAPRTVADVEGFMSSR